MTAPTTDDAPARTGRRRDEERDVAILAAAIELVAEVGYDRMSMDAVAARARASKATIYRRWPGKAELVVDAVRRLVCPDDGPRHTSGDLRADLLGVLREIRDHMAGRDGDLMIGLSLASRRDPALADALRVQIHEAKLSPKTSAIVAGAVARGELPAGADPVLLDDLLPALLLFRQLQGKETEDSMLDHLVDDVLLPVLRHPSPAHPSPAQRTPRP